MGGSGNSGYYTGGAGGSAEETPCSEVRFRTTLNTPPDPVLEDVGTVLSVRLEKVGDNSTVVAVNSDDTIVGSITDGLADLLRCLASGTKFEAEVVERNGSVHTVHVRAR